MRETNGRSRRVSTKLTALAAGLIAIFAVSTFGATSAQAASTPGSPISADFNYVGINVTALGNELNQLVLTPDTADPANPGGFLPPLHMAGTYSDTAGNFTLPTATGFQFPKLAVSIGPAAIEAEIGLTAPATGNYNDATGAMTLNPKISLTLGTDHLEDIDGLPISGTGPLKCQIAPLDVSLSTNPTNWPAPGKLFTDKVLLKDGALAGGWRTKPKVVSLVTSNASLCPLIGGLLEPVGGLFLANSTPVIASLPAATAPKLTPRPCDAGTTGTAGTPQVDCKVTPPVGCPEGQTGTPPSCVPIVVPPPAKTPYSVSKVAISPKKGTLKAGKTLKIKVSVTNSGETAGSSVVALKSSNKKVTLPKSVKITVPANSTGSATVTIKASNKVQKGKATVSAKTGGKTGTATYDLAVGKKV